MSILKNTYYNSTNGFIWAGICPTNLNKIYLLAGGDSSGNGIFYKGSIEFNNLSTFYKVNFPDALSTSLYGPESIDNNIVAIVGSYNTKNLTKGFYYRGLIKDLDNPSLYRTIIPFKKNKITVAHSTSNGLAVYVVGDISPAEFAVGNSAVYDLDKQINISEVLFPGSFSTTTYGIWYNGINEPGFESYTIAGGFRNNMEIKNFSFLVDLYYNKTSGEFYFLNWTEINTYNENNIESHIQGISVIENGEYICPCDNYQINTDGTKSKINSMTIVITRLANGFTITNYNIIDFPGSSLTSCNSVADNVVVGLYETESNEAFGYQAKYTCLLG